MPVIFFIMLKNNEKLNTANITNSSKCVVLVLLYVYCDSRIPCESSTTEIFNNVMCLNQGCTYFSKSKDPLQNSSCQKGDVKQVP